MVLLTYALCSFGNLGALSTMVGGMGVLCPSRVEDLYRLAFRALCSGLASSVMVTCVAGLNVSFVSLHFCVSQHSGSNATLV